MKRFYLTIITLFLSYSCFAKQAIIFNKSKINDMEVTYKVGHYTKGVGWQFSNAVVVILPAKKTSITKNYITINAPSTENIVNVISASEKDVYGNTVSSGDFYHENDAIISSCYANFYRDVDMDNKWNAAIVLDDNDQSPLILCSSPQNYYNAIE